MSYLSETMRGILQENPTFKLVLGMCPVLAITTSAVNGVGMGLATTFVLVCSNVFISLLRNIIPSKVRIPCYIVVIAAFVTVVDLLMNAYVTELHKALGLFIPLIVVNCIILGRAEAFANRNKPLISAFDGLGMGLGFTLSVTAVGAIRELLGNGSVFGVPLLSSAIGAIGWEFSPVICIILPPGAFIVLGLMLALINSRKKRPNAA